MARPEYDTTKWLLRDDAARILKVSPQRLSAIATERSWKRLPLDKMQPSLSARESRSGSQTARRSSLSGAG